MPDLFYEFLFEHKATIYSDDRARVKISQEHFEK